MPNIHTTKNFWGMAGAYIDAYNSTNRTLTIVLLCDDFGLIDVDGVPGILEIVEGVYQQATIALVESLYGLQKVEAGSTFPQFPGGAEIEVTEDYVLTLVEPDGYCLESVVDPQDLLPFKYKKLKLVYTWTGNMPTAFPKKPKSWKNWGGLPSPLYPSDTIDSSPYPDLSIGLSNLIIFQMRWVDTPTGHWRYGIASEYGCLLANNPDSELTPIQQEIYECFVPSVSGSEYWLDSWPFWMESRGISGSWTDTYDELCDRDVDGNLDTRVNSWLSEAAIWHEFVQPTNSWYYTQVRGRLQPGCTTKPKNSGTLPTYGGIGGAIGFPHTGRVASPTSLLINTWKKRKKL